MTSHAWLIERIRHEYEALPGLKLTEAQACRLWTASEEACRAALDALVHEGYLWRAPSGRYVAAPQHRPAVVDAELLVRCPHCGKRQAIARPPASSGHAVPAIIRCAACQRVVHIDAISA